MGSKAKYRPSRRGARKRLATAHRGPRPVDSAGLTSLSINPFAGAWGYLQLFREHVGRRLYVVFFLAMVVALTEGVGITLLVPLIGALEIGGGAESRTPAALRGLLEFFGLSGSVTGILLLIGAAFFLKAVVQFGTAVYGAYLQTDLLRELKGRVFDAYSRMSYPYYSSNNTGHFLNVIGGQVSGFYGAFNSFKAFLTRIIQAGAYLSVALWLTWEFGVVAMAVGGIVLILFRRLNQHVRRLSQETSREASKLQALLVQVLQSFKYLRSTDQMGRLRVGVMESIRRYTDHQRRKSIWNSFTVVIVEPLSIVLILGIVFVQTVVLEAPLAPVLVSILVFHRALGALMGIQSQWQNTLNAIGAVEMVRDELAALKTHEEEDGRVELGTLQNGIEFDAVSFAYDPGLGDVLDGVSLTIPARTTIALVGGSGAGKSTMVDLLTLLLKPRSGAVRIDGVSSVEVKLSSWRSQIGYVSQDTVMFDDTVAANIAMRDVDANKDPTILDRVREAARRANIASFVEELPDGYGTMIGDRGIRLSGGQRQRLFIARELFKRPSLLILDEATSALDSASERAVQESIENLHGEVTVVMIAHRLSTIRNADRVYVLERGRIIEEGGYEELRQTRGSRFQSMVQLQQV